MPFHMTSGLPRLDEMSICMLFVIKKNYALRTLFLLTPIMLFSGSATNDIVSRKAI